MSTNELSHLSPSPLLIYTALGVYAILLALVVAYVRARFSAANRLLKELKRDWDSAESRHAGLIGQAQEKITQLSVPAPPSSSTEPVFNDEMRNQVVVMGKNGMSNSDIALACGLSEGEVDLLIGMARIQVA